MDPILEDELMPPLQVLNEFCVVDFASGLRREGCTDEILDSQGFIVGCFTVEVIPLRRLPSSTAR